MAFKPNSPKEDNTKDRDIMVEGDLGDLQLCTSSDSEDDDTVKDQVICSRKVESLPDFSSSLVQTSNAPVYGHVAVANSKNVQFGNNTHFHGPVVIKQIIQDKAGVENVSYTKTEEDHEPFEKYNHPKKSEDATTSKKFQCQPWHRCVIIATCFIVVALVSTLVLLIQGKSSKSATFSTNGEEERQYCFSVVGVWWDNFVLVMLSLALVVLTWWGLVLLTLHLNNFGQKSIHHTTGNIIPDTTKFTDKPMAIAVPKAYDLLIAESHLRIVSRSDWLAQPPDSSETVKLRQPVPWVVITHTATESCHIQTECVLRVRVMQTFHIESKKWADIGYNFLVGGDGSAYYGRGWEVQGAHTLGYNKYSIAIAFIGTFNNEAPPDRQLEACKKLIDLGVRSGKLSKNYKLFGHRQLASTLSPGDKLFDIIKTWPNFVHNTSNVSALIPPY